MRFWLARA